jgi:hypothetical protein
MLSFFGDKLVQLRLETLPNHKRGQQNEFFYYLSGDSLIVEIVAIGIFSLILTYLTFTKERTVNISLALESNKLKTVVIPGDIHKKRMVG